VKERPLAGVRKVHQLDGILAHLGVHEQSHGRPGGREAGEGLEGDVDGIADAPDLNEEAVGRFLDEPSLPMRVRQSGGHSLL